MLFNYEKTNISRFHNKSITHVSNYDYDDIWHVFDSNNKYFEKLTLLIEDPLYL